MFIRTLAAISVLLSAATPAWAGNSYTVQVGYNGSAQALAYYPASSSLNVGDTITFVNFAGKHNAHSIDPAFTF